MPGRSAARLGRPLTTSAHPRRRVSLPFVLSLNCCGSQPIADDQQRLTRPPTARVRPRGSSLYVWDGREDAPQWGRHRMASWCCRYPRRPLAHATVLLPLSDALSASCQTLRAAVQSQCPTQAGGPSLDRAVAAPQTMRPIPGPAREKYRVLDGDDHIVAEAGVEGAQLTVASLDQEPGRSGAGRVL